MMKQIKRILYMFFAVMVILSASSCGHTPVSVSSQKQEGYMVVDDKGNPITLKKKPDKILTLALATDEPKRSGCQGSAERSAKRRGLDSRAERRLGGFGGFTPHRS